MNIRHYKSSDYQSLIDLYKQSSQFEVDEVTDSEENIERKIDKDPQSILLAEHDNKLIGSISIIEDGRIALLFRFVALESGSSKDDISKALLQKAESILRDRGYKEVHNTVPLEDLEALTEKERIGFTKGNPYMWFWKKIM